MDPSVTKQKLRPGTVRRIARYARPYRWLLAAFLLGTGLDALITVVNPLLLREVIEHYMTQPDSAFSIERALTIAVEVEESELEDLVGDLLQALQERSEYERCQRLLVHDLGELSYMIEQYCQDPGLLSRCDGLVNHHAETLRHAAAAR